jgi:hypothetical protein
MSEHDQITAEIRELRAQVGATIAIIDTICQVLEIRGVATRMEIAECVRNVVTVALETDIDRDQRLGLDLMSQFADRIAVTSPPTPPRPSLTIVN